MSIDLLNSTGEYSKKFQASMASLSGGHDIEFKFDYLETDLEILKGLRSYYSKVSRLLTSQSLFDSDVVLVETNSGNDGHAIEVDGELITFIDLSVYRHHLDNPNFDIFSHLLHEMLHAAHYHMNKAVAPHNRPKGKGELISRCLAEGIVVYLAEQMNPEKDNYWFNYIDSETLEAWKKSCEAKFEQDIHSFAEEEYSEEQLTNFLSLKSFEREDLLLGRRAYYQIPQFLKGSSLSVEAVLKLLPENFKRLVNSCKSYN